MRFYTKKKSNDASNGIILQQGKREDDKLIAQQEITCERRFLLSRLIIMTEMISNTHTQTLTQENTVFLGINVNAVRGGL